MKTPALFLALLATAAAATGPLTPAAAQETSDQFDAANAENRRYTDEQNRLNNRALELRQDRARALQGCSGIGSAAAAKACAGNVEIQDRQQRYRLDNQGQQQLNQHNGILQGIGVHPMQ
jgi:ABC-type transport system involved in cytochrome bd biosynthesis fused ATPase/permease subunit